MLSINAFNQYERIRHRLPQEPARNHTPLEVASILEISEHFDTFLFDAFGVLNVAEKAIDGAVESIRTLRQMDKAVMVVSNAATYHKPMMVEKFHRLGYDFSADEIISSRDALLDGLKDHPTNIRWGVISPENGQEDLEKIGIQYVFYDNPDFASCDGFLFLSSLTWDRDKQDKFLHILNRRPRPVLLGNPDLIAPMQTHVSIEPGTYVLLLDDHLYKHCKVFGKPFASIFAIAAKRLNKLGRDINPQRTIICGDTLHTDILGGNADGISTALITGHGFFKELNPYEYIKKSSITPDYLMRSI